MFFSSTFLHLTEGGRLMRRTWTITAAAVAVAALVALAAGCGGGGDKKGYALSQAEYAAALNGICNDVSSKTESLDLGSLEGFAANGDELLSIIEEATDKAK